MRDYSSLEEQYGLPIGLLSSVEKQESGGNAAAISPKGAIGNFQFMPATAKQYGIDPTDPDQSAEGAARMYADLSKKYNGDVPSMLAAYNWGQGNVDKKGLDKAPPETQSYIAHIMDGMHSYAPGQQPQQGVISRFAGAIGNAIMPDAEAADAPRADVSAFDNVAPVPPVQDNAPPFSSKLDLMLEAEHRGILPDDKKGLLDEARKRGLIPSDSVSTAATSSDQGFLSRVRGDLSNRGNIAKNIATRVATGQEGIVPGALSEIGKVGYGSAADVIGEGFKSATPDFVKNAFTSGAQGIANALDNTSVGRAIGDTVLGTTEGYGSLAKANPNISDTIDSVANIAAMGIGSKAIPPVMDGLSSGASKIGPIATKTIGKIDPRIAGLVHDASDLGINIPARVFNPGVVSGGLNKVGLMAPDTMKADVTTALSKIMGHEGTPNLDVGTVGDIQKTIGGKMDDFALKADANGGIPIAADDLTGIASDSLADESKVKKLVQKIQDRLDNGTLSGADYQGLTKKGGVLDRAINSSDSELSDTAKELRGHLDDQLEKTVNPDDLAAFREARRQYRTLKIVQPLVESGGVTGQADSASKLFNAVSRNYGSINNALKYNPELGKIAQIVNEFPETLKDTGPKKGPLAKTAALVGGDAATALGVGAVGGLPAAVGVAATLPAAYGAGKFLSSDLYKNALLKNSLPAAEKIAGPSMEGAAPMKLLAAPTELPGELLGTPSGNVRPPTIEEQTNATLTRRRAQTLGLSPDVYQVINRMKNSNAWQLATKAEQAKISAQVQDMWNKNPQTSVSDMVRAAKRSADDLAAAKGNISSNTTMGEAFKRSIGEYAKGGSVKNNLTAEFLGRKYA